MIFARELSPIIFVSDAGGAYAPPAQAFQHDKTFIEFPEEKAQ